MAALRAGLVGLGRMGRNHARVLGSLNGVDLVGVADPAGDVHGAAFWCPVVSTIDELLALSLDLAVVAIPTADHLAAGLELAAAGVPTLMEKPVATTADEARQLVAAFESADLLNAVGHIERFNPALQAMRERLENGDLGDVYQVATRRQGPFPNRISDVGVVKDLATHDLDLTAWVLQSEYAQVSAVTQHRSGRPHEDLISITAAMKDGTVANHLVNWLSPLKERCTVVTGEKGAFVADTLHGDLTFHENGMIATTWESVSTFRGVSEGNSVRYAIPKPEPLWVQHENFRDAVLGKTTDIVSMREGMRAVAVADACIRSAQEGRTVVLDREGVEQ